MMVNNTVKVKNPTRNYGAWGTLCLLVTRGVIGRNEGMRSRGYLQDNFAAVVEGAG